MKKVWLLGLSWLGMSLLLTARVGAQPEEERPAREDERAEMAEMQRMMARQQEALANARRQMQEQEARLREEQMRRGQGPMRPGPDSRVGRVFRLTPAVKGEVDVLNDLDELPEVSVILLPEHIAVWGPESAVSTVAQILAALDPTTQPPSVALAVRAYLAAEMLPPNFAAPKDDPLLAQVQERTGYTNVAVLTEVDLPGVEGEVLNVEREMGVEGDQGGLRGGLRLTATPQVVGGPQVQLKVRVNLELGLGPGGFHRLQHEGVLRTPSGQAVLVVSADPILHTALVLALTPTMGK